MGAGVLYTPTDHSLTMLKSIKLALCLENVGTPDFNNVLIYKK